MRTPLELLASRSNILFAAYLHVGCVVLETGPLTWPHDAILLRNREAKAVAMSWRTAGVHSFSLAAAELQGKRMRVLDVQLGDLSGRGVIDAMYG